MAPSSTVLHHIQCTVDSFDWPFPCFPQAQQEYLEVPDSACGFGLDLAWIWLVVQVLMGEGLRSVIMHEMGHILGLRLQRFEMPCRLQKPVPSLVLREMFGYTVLLQKCAGDCFFPNPVHSRCFEFL